jgi:hypothetical protein
VRFKGIYLSIKYFQIDVLSAICSAGLGCVSNDFIRIRKECEPYIVWQCVYDDSNNPSLHFNDLRHN